MNGMSIPVSVWLFKKLDYIIVLVRRPYLTYHFSHRLAWVGDELFSKSWLDGLKMGSPLGLCFMILAPLLRRSKTWKNSSPQSLAKLLGIDWVGFLVIIYHISIVRFRRVYTTSKPGVAMCIHVQSILSDGFFWIHLVYQQATRFKDCLYRALSIYIKKSDNYPFTLKILKIWISIIVYTGDCFIPMFLQVVYPIISQSPVAYQPLKHLKPITSWPPSLILVIFLWSGCNML